MDGSSCDGAIKTSKLGLYWDTCDAEAKESNAVGTEQSNVQVDFTHKGCKCKSSWAYHSTQKHGCSTSADAQTPWCLVVDQDACRAKGGQESSSIPGEVWDTCNLGDPTDHDCHCKHEWLYSGEVFTGCNSTQDADGKWCYVSDGEGCSGAVKTAKTGEYWDTCNGK
jgi:hypothetical protein